MATASLAPRRWLPLGLAAAALAGAALALRAGAPPRPLAPAAHRARPHRAAPRAHRARPHRAAPVPAPRTPRDDAAPPPVALRRVPARAASAEACPTLVRPDRHGRWVTRDDVVPRLGFVDGDELLALVNRSPRFVLAPDYAPGDLVEVDTGRELPAAACVPPRRQCLRRDAASALRAMLDAMRAAGLPGHVHSAFRGFHTQCEVFHEWSRGEGGGFCHATTSSAIAGHSQHQLGTAVDLFTAAWARAFANPMLSAFGCTAGGRWIADHAWEFGWVIPYPLPLAERAAGSDCRRREGGHDDTIDPRTGYRYEPWHLRFIGVDAAARFRAAWLERGVGAPGEITLEQWLREAHGLDGDVDLPVCDGCACGLCASFHASPPSVARAARGGPRPSGPCGDRALLLGADGEPAPADGEPALTHVAARREALGVRVTVTVRVPARTVTQTPVTSPFAGVYAAGMTWRALAPQPQRRFAALARPYPDLRGAWRVAVAPPDDLSWPWRSALRHPSTPAWVNGANQRLPATPGLTQVEVIVPLGADRLRVTLLRDGSPQGPALEAPVR